MKDNSILDPVESFASLSQTVHNHAGTFFDNLVTKSAVKKDENAQTCDDYYFNLNLYEKASKKARSTRTLKIFLIILTVILLLASVICLYQAFIDTKSDIFLPCLLVGIGLIVVSIALIIVLVKVVNKRLKEREKRASELHAKCQQLLLEANEQVAPLNALYDWGLQNEVIKEAVPLLQMDRNFDVEKFQYMRQKYGLTANTNQKSSTFFVQSGSIIGNPFLLERDFVQIDGNKTYTGSITISWTTTSTDSNGRSTVHTHTQVLTASVTKFCPYYSYTTHLVYANDAAPDLSFSRGPQVSTFDSDSKIKSKIKKGKKKADKLVKTTLNDDDPTTNFMSMGNTEFDSLFHAFDRDHEVQFRLLFTPLAQQNMLKLLKSKQPYGDDFSFAKAKRLNYIRSAHAQEQDIYGNPSNYVDFDIRVSRNKFINYVDSYFQSLYFDLAPLLSIPLYQMTKTKEFIYDEGYVSNTTYHECEALANSFDEDYVKPQDAGTPSIRKISIVGKVNKCDKVLLRTRAFRVEPRVDFISKVGGDGRVHSIPVPWNEYIPVERELYMITKNADASRNDFMSNLMKNPGFANVAGKFGQRYSFQRRLFAMLINGNFSESDANELENILKSKA